MLTTAQIERFNTFGFVVLPGFLARYAEGRRREAPLFATPTPPPTTSG